ncbi:hypothetical protein Q8A73_005043 [Channa argus]|nr:hypothetical protein Q8A73_005043 [Channa argus]
MKHQGAIIAANESTAQSTVAFETQERSIFNLVQQLQKAHQDLEVCTTELQSSAENNENGEPEHYKKFQALKKGIVVLIIKLQHEQQVLSLKREQQSQVPSKYQWIRTHKDQEQQTWLLEQTAESKCDRAQQDVCEMIVNNQIDQQLKDKVTAEEVNQTSRAD